VAHCTTINEKCNIIIMVYILRTWRGWGIFQFTGDLYTKTRKITGNKQSKITHFQQNVDHVYIEI